MIADKAPPRNGRSSSPPLNTPPGVGPVAYRRVNNLTTMRQRLLDAGCTPHRGPLRVDGDRWICQAAGLLSALGRLPRARPVTIARLAYPELAAHCLDAVLARLGIPRPAGRHRAMPDAEVTAAAFERMITEGSGTGLWAELRDLDRRAGRPPGAVRPAARGTAQDMLF